MALSRVYQFDAQTTLTEAKLEGEFDNIYNNALSLISPLTAALACGNQDLTGIDELAFTDAAAAASASGRLRRNGTNLEYHDGTASRVIYKVSGTDVTLADGGTGASLTDPDADRILFWDDSAGAVTWLTAGEGLTISATTMTAGFAAGTVMLFAQASAPTGWTRVVDAGNTDAVIIQRTNSEVPGTGGSWTVSGLTNSTPTFTGSAMSGHAHVIPLRGPSGSNLGTNNANFGQGAADQTIARDVAFTASPGTANQSFDLTSSTSAGTPSGTVSAPTISSDASWRPKYREVIVASKD